jgi:hypothetical protein
MIKDIIASALTGIGIILTIGSVGALEFGTIGITQCIVQTAICIAVTATGVWIGNK